MSDYETHKIVRDGYTYVVTIVAWSGNVSPWRAEIDCDGEPCGKTGACKSEYAALRAATRLIAKVHAKKSQSGYEVRP